MIRAASLFFLLVALVAAPSAARAGWVLKSKETAVRHTGDKLDPQESTMSIAKNKVRIEQAQTTTILDYGKKTFAILNPNQSYFWSGTLDEYLRQMSRDRSASLHRRMGKQADDMNFERKKIDPKSLPPVAIEKTGVTETIAGHPATKYEIKAQGEVLLEVWLAEDLKVASDLDPKLFLDYESRISETMLGSGAKPFVALYRNDDYRKLLDSGYVLKSITHHRAGSYEREVTEIRSEDVPATAFDVPDSYRRVRLADVLPSAPQS
jgi:hypothetical protein